MALLSVGALPLQWGIGTLVERKDGVRAWGLRGAIVWGLCFLGADSHPWDLGSFHLSFQLLGGRVGHLMSHVALRGQPVRSCPFGLG